MDVRNHARIQQFKAQQAEREAAGGAAMQTEGAEEEEEIKISESFGTISEIFFLTLRTLHVLGYFPSFFLFERPVVKRVRYCSDQSSNVCGTDGACVYTRPSRVVKDLHKLSQDLHERHAELQVKPVVKLV
eukprot:2668848-Rhodomonas_salina.1